LKELLNKIHLGDSLELMKQLPDNSIDLVVTDPPYEVMVSEKSGTGKTHISGTDKFRTSIQGIKDGFDVEAYFAQFSRVCKKFNAFIFCSNTQLGKLIAAGESLGHTVTTLAWHKTNTTPFANGVWRSDLEFCVHIREKSATFKGDAKLKSKIYISPTERSRFGHPTEKPLELIEKYIKIGSNDGDLVLDPFMGSGTTANACVNLRRNFIGYEIDEIYHKTACERVELARGNCGLFDFKKGSA